MSLWDGLVEWCQSLLRLGVEEGSKWAHLFIIGKVQQRQQQQQQQEGDGDKSALLGSVTSSQAKISGRGRFDKNYITVKFTSVA